uniref:NADH-ubiquinone oxidoreductase chain 2 n=1 Tax=Stenocercus crassicaudatus TaxID=81828 RepID=Q9ZYS7_9SAUR|nr:NADH dehydrogenase subunit 2 [Stenocercus crassicaudatus]
MNPATSTIILSSLATGTIITASSFHWFMAWIGLEMNTLAIIPIISKQHHPRATEAATKYFLTQATASAMILFSSMINAWQSGMWNITQPLSPTSSILLTIALMMKLGLAPAHFWLPEVLQGTTTPTALIISTWQKLAPMALIYLTANNLSPTTLILMGTLSTWIGGWGGLNQTQTRKLMAYSSIAHFGWMMTITPMLTNIMLLNLMIYTLMTTSLFMTLILTKSKTLQNMTTTWTLSPALTTIALLTLLSLGGLPPLSGFMPKWLILNELINQNLIIVSALLAMSTLLSLFFYLRLTYITALTLPPNTPNTTYKWRFMPPMPLLLTSTLPMTLLMLPITPIMTQ